MLDEKSIEQSSKIVKELINEEKIVKPNPKTCEFFAKQSNNKPRKSQKLRNRNQKNHTKIKINLQISIF